MKIFKGFALALSLLTIIPFFKVHDFYKGINGYAVMFYPLIGFFIGLILYATWLLLNPYMPTLHLGLLIFGLWVLITGALHLDGLSDTIDGLFVHKDKALEVMKDPHTGGMGMIFTVTFLILKASSLAYLEAMYLLPVILMLSRFNAVVAIYIYPYIGGGIASLAKNELQLSQVFIAFLYVVVITLLISSFSLVVFSLLILFILKLFFIKRYNGLSGDIYGFIIEITELILLNIIIIGFL